jgi:HlyD family secretion protein
MKKLLIALLIVAAAAVFFLRPRGGSVFVYAGTIEATEVDVSARLSSPIEAFDAKEGKDVQAGQVLVRLKGDDVRLASRRADVDYQRAERLFKGGNLSQDALDRARFQRDDAALKVDWCEVKAPLSGTVLRTYHEAGELTAPGAKLLTLADLSEVWGMIYVPQPAVSKISLGRAVEGTLPEMRGSSFKGRVAFIRPEAEFTPKNVQTREERTRLVYGVKIVFPNPDRILKPGMTVEVRLPEEP